MIDDIDDIFYRCNSLENEELKKEVIYLYGGVENLFKGDEYSEDLRLELQELYPDYLNVLRKNRKDMEEYDHGIVIAGIKRLDNYFCSGVVFTLICTYMYITI